MSTKYCQCELVKKVNFESTIKQIAFIPAKYANVGSMLKIRKEDGTWDWGWEVVWAGKPTEIIVDIHKAIRNHRKNTGDSLPK